MTDEFEDKLMEEFEDKLMEEFKDKREELGFFDAKEKSLLKERLMRYVDENPAKDLSGTRGASLVYSIQNSFFGSFVVPAFTIALVFSGVGVAAAAENSLPGDTLYPVKVSLNETVREVFTFGQEAKKEWGIRQVERRFEEIALLEEKGRVGPEEEIIIKERLNRHVENLDRIAINFERKGKTEKAELLYLKLGEVFEKETTNEKITLALADNASDSSPAEESNNGEGGKNREVSQTITINVARDENNGEGENSENPSGDTRGEGVGVEVQAIEDKNNLAINNDSLEAEIGGIILAKDNKISSADNLKVHIEFRAREAKIKAEIEKIKQEVPTNLSEEDSEEIEGLLEELERALIDGDQRLFNRIYDDINSLIGNCSPFIFC